MTETCNDHFLSTEETQALHATTGVQVKGGEASDIIKTLTELEKSAALGGDAKTQAHIRQALNILIKNHPQSARIALDKMDEGTPTHDHLKAQIAAQAAHNPTVGQAQECLVGGFLSVPRLFGGSKQPADDRSTLRH